MATTIAPLTSSFRPIANQPGELKTTIVAEVDLVTDDESDQFTFGNTLPVFNLGDIFGSSDPVIGKPSIGAAEASVSSESVGNLRDIITTSTSKGNRPVQLSNVSSNSPSSSNDLRIPQAGNRPSVLSSSLDGLRNGPNSFPSYTSPSGRWCLKCDAMTYTGCASAPYEQCELGDLDQCFIEIRETIGKVDHIMSGCKSKQACANLKKENFVIDSALDSATKLTDQCKPDNKLARMRFGRVQSVCRQCFSSSDGDVLNSLHQGTGEELNIPQWDGTFWKLSNTGDSKTRSFWVEDLYSVQQGNI